MPQSMKQLNFLEWLETLSDDELFHIVDRLCAAADALHAAARQRQSLRADDLLKFDTHSFTKLFLN